MFLKNPNYSKKSEFQQNLFFFQKSKYLSIDENRNIFAKVENVCQ